MRLRIAIGLYAKNVGFRVFNRVIELPVMPENIRAGYLTLPCDDPDESLTYSVSNGMYYMYWHVNVEDEHGELCDAEWWLKFHADWLRNDGFVESVNEDTDKK